MKWWIFNYGKSYDANLAKSLFLFFGALLGMILLLLLDFLKNISENNFVLRIGLLVLYIIFMLKFANYYKNKVFEWDKKQMEESK